MDFPPNLAPVEDAPDVRTGRKKIKAGYVVASLFTGLIALGIVGFVWSVPSGSRTAVDAEIAEAKALGIPVDEGDLSAIVLPKNQVNAASLIPKDFDRRKAGQLLSKLRLAVRGRGNDDYRKLVQQIKPYHPLIEKLLTASSFRRDPLSTEPFDNNALTLYIVAAFAGHEAAWAYFEGDFEGASKWLNKMKRLGEMLAEDPTLDSQWRAIAIFNGYLKRVEWAARRADSQRELDELDRLLEAPLQLKPASYYAGGTVYRALNYFRNVDYQKLILQNLLPQKAPEEGAEKRSELVVEAKQRKGAPENWMNGVVFSAYLNRWKKLWPKLESDPNKVMEILDDEYAQMRKSKDPLILALTAGYYFPSSFPLHSQAIKTRQLVTSTFLKCRRFQLLNGRPPQSLQEAKLNPIDPFSGKSLIYVTRDDRLGVYSVGIDRQDDGGSSSRSKKKSRGTRDQDWTDDIAASNLAPTLGPTLSLKQQMSREPRKDARG